VTVASRTTNFSHDVVFDQFRGRVEDLRSITFELQTDAETSLRVRNTGGSASIFTVGATVTVTLGGAGNTGTLGSLVALDVPIPPANQIGQTSNSRMLEPDPLNFNSNIQNTASSFIVNEAGLRFAESGNGLPTLTTMAEFFPYVGAGTFVLPLTAIAETRVLGSTNRLFIASTLAGARIRVTFTSVPEPAAAALLGLGLASVVVVGWRRRRHASI
jgi:hypothetical protein